jgi:hypothetical protein
MKKVSKVEVKCLPTSLSRSPNNPFFRKMTPSDNVDIISLR